MEAKQKEKDLLQPNIERLKVRYYVDGNLVEKELKLFDIQLDEKNKLKDVLGTMQEQLRLLFSEVEALRKELAAVKVQMLSSSLEIKKDHEIIVELAKETDELLKRVITVEGGTLL